MWTVGVLSLPPVHWTEIVSSGVVLLAGAPLGPEWGIAAIARGLAFWIRTTTTFNVSNNVGWCWSCIRWSNNTPTGTHSEETTTEQVISQEQSTTTAAMTVLWNKVALAAALGGVVPLSAAILLGPLVVQELLPVIAGIQSPHHLRCR